MVLGGVDGRVMVMFGLREDLRVTFMALVDDVAGSAPGAGWTVVEVPS